MFNYLELANVKKRLSDLNKLGEKCFYSSRTMWEIRQGHNGVRKYVTTRASIKGRR